MKNNIKPFLLGLFAATFMASCSTAPAEKQFPHIGEHETVEKQVDGNTAVDTIYHTIPAFDFINQDSVHVTNATFDNKIYIANFFFTHCPSICPTMQRNLLKIYEKYKDDDRIAFISHSIDFKYDTPSVLKEYATKLGVTNDQWQFVMGSKKDIYGIAEAYYVYTKEDATVPGGYDHQGYFMLIDKDRHIRGAYDGTDDQQVANLTEDLEIILKQQFAK